MIGIGADAQGTHRRPGFNHCTVGASGVPQKAAGAF